MENQVNIKTLHMDKAQFLDRIFEITTADNMAGVGEVFSGVLDTSVSKSGQQGRNVAHKIYGQFVTQYLLVLASWLKSLDQQDYRHLAAAGMIHMRKAEQRGGGAAYTGPNPVLGQTRRSDLGVLDEDLWGTNQQFAAIHIPPAAFIHHSMEIGIASMLSNLIPVLVDRIERHAPDVQPYEGDTLEVLGLEVLHAYGDWLTRQLAADDEHLARWVIGKAGEVAFIKGVRDEATLLSVEK